MTSKLNGNVKYFLAATTLIIMAVGWGATWGVLDTKVENLNKQTISLDTDKLDCDVYQANVEKIQIQIENIEQSQTRIEAKLNKILDG